MKKINIQFFSTLHENIEFIKEASKKNLNIMLYTNGYKKRINVNNINIDNIENLFFDEYKYNNHWQFQFVFSCNVFDDSPNSYNEFCVKNVNSLYLTVGENNKNILKESWLASSIFLNDIASFLVFEALAKHVKKKTFCGAFLFVEDEMRKFDKNIRYTKGALDFNKKGGKIFQVNENIHFILDVDAKNKTK
jgi:hypothetical protein